MFKPYYGKCEGKPGKTEGCGNLGWIRTNTRRLCDKCEAAKSDKPKPIPKVSPKQAKFIGDSKNYYRQQIAQHIVKNNGRCPCEECGVEIINPTGMNVSHILSSATHKELYHHPENSNILCKVGDNPKDWGASCHNKWEGRDKTKMKIWAANQIIIEKLLNEKRP